MYGQSAHYFLILIILFYLFLLVSKAINGNQTPLLRPPSPPWLVAVNHLLRQKNALCEDEFLEMIQESETKWQMAKLDQWKQDLTFSKYLTSYSVRLLLGYDGSLHTKVMLFCSIFSARSSLISDGAAERRRKRTEVCLGFNDFWTLDVLFTQSCAATVKWGRLKKRL